MMPWRKRAARAEEQADRAKEECAEVQRNWMEAIVLAEKSKNQRETNGWTGKVLDVFSGRG